MSEDVARLGDLLRETTPRPGAFGRPAPAAPFDVSERDPDEPETGDDDDRWWDRPEPEFEPLEPGLLNSGAEAEQPIADDGEPLPPGSPAIAASPQAVPGGRFVFDAPETIPSLWGQGSTVLWARGEALEIVGPDGVGKTSIAQQLMLALVGIRPPELLGFPVEPIEGRILYIAADRPRQAQRSIRRMVTEADRATLDERVIFWKGPLPFDLTEDPEQFAAFVRALGATVVFIDSLKDAALDLSKDETGSRVNASLQTAIAAGIEVVVLHHQRKGQQGAPKPRRIADVYGSRWLTAGMGSVLMLWGDPGDLVVELTHLKQPAEVAGPLSIVHDHETGTSTAQASDLDLETLVARAGLVGLTVANAAVIAFGASDTKPEPAKIERARRRLEALVRDDKARRRDDPDGLARYYPAEATAQSALEIEP